MVVIIRDDALDSKTFLRGNFSIPGRQLPKIYIICPKFLHGSSLSDFLRERKFFQPEGVALHSHKLFAVGASAASTSIPTRAQQSRSIFGVEESGAQKIVDSHTSLFSC